MKTVTLYVSEPVYEDFKRWARLQDRSTSELIREAMELYRRQHLQQRTSLTDRRPASAGGPIQPLGADDDRLGDMLDDPRS